MTQPRFGPMLLALVVTPIVLTVIFLSMGSRWESQLEVALSDASVFHQLASSREGAKIQGYALQAAAMRRPDLLPVFGSSELGGLETNPFHASNVFADKPSGFEPFLVGRGGYQSLIHFLNISSLGERLSHKRVAVLISPQWFWREGISQPYFDSNFSALHAYRMVFSSRVRPALKAQAARRLLSFPSVTARYPVLAMLLKGYVSPFGIDRLHAKLVEPLGRLQLSCLEAQDQWDSLALLRRAVTPRIPAETGPLVAAKGPSWLSLLGPAAAAGAKAATNNEFGVYDQYYDEYIRNDRDKLKDSWKWVSWAESVEYDDLQMVLTLLRDLQMDAVFVIVPVNGPWSDFMGMHLDERRKYYRHVTSLIRRNGFRVADFSDHEYDMYFLKDVMHLGWKGWVYVDETLDRQYRDGSE